MPSKISLEILKKKPKTCCKLVFLTKQFKKKNIVYTFLKHFLNTMIKNMKIQNILDIIKTKKSIQLNKCTDQIFLMKILI